MTDKELLECAARAAGINRYYYDTYLGEWGMIEDDPESGWWNPLTDDGDALRLLAKLRMSVIFPTAIGRDFIEVRGISQHKETLFDDLNGAVRRAIVRAAAEIGKKMI